MYLDCRVPGENKYGNLALHVDGSLKFENVLLRFRGLRYENVYIRKAQQQL
jgi:hypothetical protein